jgi:uncharacterized protein (DUF1697 family)
MNTVIALFRGINVVGNNILPMRDLKPLLENLGLRNVQTYIQSGNVVFQTNKKIPGELAKRIGLAVKTNHGFEPKILFLKHSELQEIIDANPFEGEDGRSQYFFFLESAPTNPDLTKIGSLKSDTEEYKLVNRVFYLFAPDGIGRSRLASRVERILGVTTTARNRNTVIKLLSMSAQ